MRAKHWVAMTLFIALLVACAATSAPQVPTVVQPSPTFPARPVDTPPGPTATPRGFTQFFDPGDRVFFHLGERKQVIWLEAVEPSLDPNSPGPGAVLLGDPKLSIMWNYGGVTKYGTPPDNSLNAEIKYRADGTILGYEVSSYEMWEWDIIEPTAP